MLRTTVASGLLAKDQQRIGVMFLIVVAVAFFLGSIFAAGVRTGAVRDDGNGASRA